MKLSKNRQKRLEAIFAALDQLSGCATAQAVAKKLGINMKVVVRAFKGSPKQVFVVRDRGVKSLWMNTQAQSREIEESVASYNEFVHGTAYPRHVFGVGHINMSDRYMRNRWGDG